MALQETAEGKIDRFAAWLSQINLRLDIVPGMVWATPPATASRVRVTSGRRPHDRARRLFGRALLGGLALHAALRVALASAAMMPGGVAM